MVHVQTIFPQVFILVTFVQTGALMNKIGGLHVHLDHDPVFHDGGFGAEIRGWLEGTVEHNKGGSRHFPLLNKVKIHQNEYRMSGVEYSLTWQAGVLPT